MVRHVEKLRAEQQLSALPAKGCFLFKRQVKVGQAGATECIPLQVTVSWRRASAGSSRRHGAGITSRDQEVAGIKEEVPRSGHAVYHKRLNLPRVQLLLAAAGPVRTNERGNTVSARSGNGRAA